MNSLLAVLSAVILSFTFYAPKAAATEVYEDQKAEQYKVCIRALKDLFNVTREQRDLILDGFLLEGDDIDVLTDKSSKEKDEVTVPLAKLRLQMTRQQYTSSYNNTKGEQAWYLGNAMAKCNGLDQIIKSAKRPN